MIQNIFRKIASSLILDSSNIISCEFIQQANQDTDLRFGAVIASSVKVKVRGSYDEAIVVGDRLQYEQREGSAEENPGLSNPRMLMFYVADVQIVSRSSYEFVAYDSIFLLDKDASDWLRDHQTDFPMSIDSLFEHASSETGLSIQYDTSNAVNTDCMIPTFYADNLTWRDIISFVAEIMGCYAEAHFITRDVTNQQTGAVTRIETEYLYLQPILGEESYSFVGTTPEDDDEICYFKDGLNYENYETELVTRVKIGVNDNDVGVCYPPVAENENSDEYNTALISGNLILTNIADIQTLESIAEQLLYQYMDVGAYVPCRIEFPSNTNIRLGDSITVTDAQGNTFGSYIFKITTTSSKIIIESTGNKNRAATAVTVQKRYSNIEGRMFALQVDVTGLQAKATDLEGNLTELTGGIEGLSAKFESTFKGGTNLISNSSGVNGLSNWEETNNVTSITDSDTVSHTVSHYCFRLKGNAGAPAKLITRENIHLIAGQAYTLSCKIKKSSIQNCYICLDIDGVKHYAFNSTATVDDWTDYSVTVESANGENAQIILLANGSGSDEFLVADLMLISQNIPAGWTPAPDEIYTTGVKVDREGITISREDGTTRITNTEFSGYNANNEKVFSVNGNVTQMRKVEASDELIIGRCRFIASPDGQGLNITLN